MSRKPPKVLLDTNFLMIPARFGVDILAELERLLLNPRILVERHVLEELERLKERGEAEARKVCLAKTLVRDFSFLDEELNSGESIDDLIVRLSLSRGYIVGTTDTLLRKRLRAKGIPVVYLRQKSFLEIEGWTP